LKASENGLTHELNPTGPTSKSVYKRINGKMESLVETSSHICVEANQKGFISSNATYTSSS